MRNGGSTETVHVVLRSLRPELVKRDDHTRGMDTYLELPL